MIIYLDTSALIKLYIKEIGSDTVHSMIETADMAATSKVAYVETLSAFNRLRREEKLFNKDYLQIKDSFLQDWPQLIIIELSDHVINLGSELLEKHPLSGFDAIHLSSALLLKKQVKQKIMEDVGILVYGMHLMCIWRYFLLLVHKLPYYQEDRLLCSFLQLTFYIPSGLTACR